MNSHSNQVFPFYPASYALYKFMLAGFFAIVVSLPFIEATITIQAPAVVRPGSEVTLLRSNVSGKVLFVSAFENKKVIQGEILYTIHSESLNEEERFLNGEIIRNSRFMKDIRRLIRSTESIQTETALKPKLESDVYRQSWSGFYQKLDDARTVQAKAQQDFNRQSKLHQQQVIPTAELETWQFELQKANDHVREIIEIQRGLWQDELNRLGQKNSELQSLMVRKQKDIENHILRAPVSGTLQNVPGIYPGSFVAVNQDLGQISPDAILVAVACIKPGDVGLLRVNMPVKMQVDAFNYNQWGLASGSILNVSEDVKIVEGTPIFEVRCSLHKDFLQLKTGYKGYLKKGMSLRARFIVTERSLWELLYDKADSWMNPYTGNEK